MTIASHDLYPHVPQVPPVPVVTPEKRGHRGATSSGGHPLVPPALLGNSGAHALARKSVWPFLAAVLLPIMGTLLVLYALSLWGQPSEAGVVPPVLQVAVSPSAGTVPDGS
jgi:hypothetical protein